MQGYTLNAFYHALHKTLYCSDDLAQGLTLKRKAYAVKCRYLQCNDFFIKFLLLDLDYPNACFAWCDRNLPQPNFILENPANGHCHYVYALKYPICRTDNAALKPLIYFAKIQQAYTAALKADPCYVGLIAKNPLSTTWQREFYPWPAEIAPYDLDYLADFVELPKTLTKRAAIGEGRNCYLFNALRKIAYREVLFYKKHGATQADFYQFLLGKIEKLNQFANAPSLEYREYKHIAQSVAKWTWRNFSPAKFSQIQRARGVKSGQCKTKLREEIKNKALTILNDIPPTLSDIKHNNDIFNFVLKKLEEN